MLKGIVVIDKSLLGRRVKLQKSNQNRGLEIWIFLLVERELNRLPLYPMSNRTEATLLPIIETRLKVVVHLQ